MSSHLLQPLGGRLFTRSVAVFAPLALLGLLLVVKRLFFGLGDVSDLNGGYPWGIWIAFDLLIGTGFACGGWALAWAVYVFNRGEFHPLVRPALLASLFGYSMGGLSIAIDLGRYWNMPNFFLPAYFNPNSVLFETAVCMTIYIGVMTLELLPALFERLGWKVSLKRINGVMFFIIGLGALLPMMHQSSMGSLMIVAGHKVHPLWQGYELLPLLSLLTAFIMGFSIVIFEGSLLKASKTMSDDETPLFRKLSNVIKGLVWLFLILRVGEIIWRDKLPLVFNSGWYSVLFGTELLLMVVPLVLLHVKRTGNSPRALFVAAVLMLLGAALWRMDYSLVAYNPGTGYHYFPTTSEILISVGFVAIEVVAYILLIRLLPILPAQAKKSAHLRNEVKS
ncbi:Ni/Fe-hydrogenase cytochrome b subunit [Salmonella enterica subsp. enterica serovar Choleraesuis]|nr:Ni/Fe-hydrogenase cytochrome b subunit [Salmonella enterica subsp. enterica serovar Choleraesuis]